MGKLWTSRPVAPQPEGHLVWLHRFPNHPKQLNAELIQIQLIPKPSTERLNDARGVIPRPVETPIYR
ncbi:MAG TPA: hypothetical protein VHN13_12560 [Candidatus Tectomicrobia bacterium]|nr:hypothetical protein [Candidatus Tectomicrobia bacterium]